MKLNDVIKKMRAAHDMGRSAYIEVTIPGQRATEFIVNSCESIENKIAYYEGAYDENGIHRRNSDIKIVGAGDASELVSILFGDLRKGEQERAEASLC